MERINWKKIDIITYGGDLMSEECKAEVRKAYDLLDTCEFRGERAKAAYIRRRLEERKNYIMR